MANSNRTPSNELLTFFCMSEGNGDWPPENVKWRKLFAKERKTEKDLAEMHRLAEIVHWKMDERLQYERAEALKNALERIMTESALALYEKQIEKAINERDNNEYRRLHKQRGL